MKESKFEVIVIYPKHDKSTGEIVSGDDDSLLYCATKKRAFSFAIKESLKKKHFESMVYGYDYKGDVVGHWYFKNGVMTWNMFGN